MRNKVGRGKQESALGKLRAGRRRTKCLPVCWILGCCQLNHLGSSLAPGYPELQRRASRRRSGYRRASSTPFCRTRPLFLDLKDSGQEWKVHRKPSTSSSGSPAFSRTKANHRNSELQTRGLGHEGVNTLKAWNGKVLCRNGGTCCFPNTGEDSHPENGTITHGTPHSATGAMRAQRYKDFQISVPK